MRLKETLKEIDDMSLFFLFLFNILSIHKLDINQEKVFIMIKFIYK